MAKKTKAKSHQYQWSTVFDCKVEVLHMGHFPTTRIIKLPDGKEVESDMEYLTILKEDR